MNVAVFAYKFATAFSFAWFLRDKFNVHSAANDCASYVLEIRRRIWSDFSHSTFVQGV